MERYNNSTTKNERINIMFKNVIYKQSLSLCFKCFPLEIIKNKVERTCFFKLLKVLRIQIGVSGVI